MMDNAIYVAFFLRAVGQDLDSVLSYEKRVLVLRRGLPVLGGDRPAVVLVDAALPGSGVDHGLDGEGHAGLEGEVVAVPEMQHLGLLVELAADAVTAVVADNGEVVLLGDGLDDVADNGQINARPYGLYRLVEALLGDLAEPFVPGARLAANYIHAGGVAVEVVLYDSDVNVDDVARLELLRTGNAVADYVVHGDAGRGGIGRHAFGLIAEAGGDALLNVNGVVVGEFVELGRRHARLHKGREVVEELGGEKIDIIEYSDEPEKYISAALSPATVCKVEIVDEEKKSCKATVPDGQLSLAIGNKGQNARLAARLTGWRIDIRPESGFFGEDEDEDEKQDEVPENTEAENTEEAVESSEE